MSEDEALGRPIGWWLKEADVRLDACFDEVLVGSGADRRDWQVLASLAKGPMRHADAVASLTSFDPPAVIDAVLDRLQSRGWVERSADILRLTPSGVRQQAAVAPSVDGVRRRVAEALPQDDYVVLVRLLARLVTALGPEA